MKCLNCSQDNKDAAKICKKCGRDLAVAPAWFPDWKWHGRALGIIYACVTAIFLIVTFVLRQLPKPYNLRKLPPEMTPWLKR